jgi:hypothetical protein
MVESASRGNPQPVRNCSIGPPGLHRSGSADAASILARARISLELVQFGNRHHQHALALGDEHEFLPGLPGLRLGT